MRAVVLGHVYVDPANRGKLRSLAGQGCAVAVAVPESWPFPAPRGTLRAAWGDDGGLRIAPVPVQRPATDSATWDRKTIRQLLRDLRPDVVQVEEEPQTQAAAAVAAAAARLGIPTVIYSAESLERNFPARQRLRRRRVLGRAAGLLAPNRHARQLLLRTRPDLPAEVLPQLGIPVPTPHTRQVQGLSIGFIGRLVPERGLDLLFRACVQVYGAWEIVVVGTGPAQEELEHLAERLGISSRIVWLGALPPAELDSAWQRLDCLALPARTTPRWMEAHGRIVMEAMARGLPVVASDSGALPDVVGDAGLLVPEDDVDALSRALRLLQETPERGRAIGMAARARIMDQFMDTALARRTLAFWRRIAHPED